jgi:hypothetical protein
VRRSPSYRQRSRHSLQHAAVNPATSVSGGGHHPSLSLNFAKNSLFDFDEQSSVLTNNIRPHNTLPRATMNIFLFIFMLAFALLIQPVAADAGDVIACASRPAHALPVAQWCMVWKKMRWIVMLVVPRCRCI